MNKDSKQGGKKCRLLKLKGLKSIIVKFIILIDGCGKSNQFFNVDKYMNELSKYNIPFNQYMKELRERIWNEVLLQ